MVWEKPDTRVGSISKLEFRVVFNKIPEIRAWMDNNDRAVQKVINDKFITNVFIDDKDKALELFNILLKHDVAVSMDSSMKGCRVQFGRAVWEVRA